MKGMTAGSWPRLFDTFHWIGVLFNADSSHAGPLTIIGSPHDAQCVSISCVAVGDTGMLTVSKMLRSMSSCSLEVMKLGPGIHFKESEIAKPLAQTPSKPARLLR